MWAGKNQQSWKEWFGHGQWSQDGGWSQSSASQERWPSGPRNNDAAEDKHRFPNFENMETSETKQKAVNKAHGEQTGPLAFQSWWLGANRCRSSSAMRGRASTGPLCGCRACGRESGEAGYASER